MAFGTVSLESDFVSLLDDLETPPTPSFQLETTVGGGGGFVEYDGDRHRENVYFGDIGGYETCLAYRAAKNWL